MKESNGHYYEMLGLTFNTQKELMEFLGIESRGAFRGMREKGTIKRIDNSGPKGHKSTLANGKSK